MSDNKEIQLIEKELGITHPQITKEQIQAAYALNLCSVSVSQIIDYNDINILEQEYDTILNNLNLENMPKDEALLDIMKRLLETITFFRIQELEKTRIEKDYQYKMKNAIWRAMPNPGAVISAGVSKNFGGKVISLAATVGTSYMNYRKNRSEYQYEKEDRNWTLKRTAIEQFETLQQQLFETSWRLADTYEFPDELRLSEKQIKQFNSILMDKDEIRKYERLNSIKHKFMAYPLFWYYFGNTANSIALSEHYGLDEDEKEVYRNTAKTCFEYFTIINKYELLREDKIAASCYLEYVDLLNPITEKDKFHSLLAKAVQSAENDMDVLQLCAISYMKIGALEEASYILRQLVNEQYNEVTNAQLLSTIYVYKYIDDKSDTITASYKLLATRIPSQYLFPIPDKKRSENKEELQAKFIKAQKKILLTKYQLSLNDFIKKYEAKINRIVPIPDELEHFVSDDIYADKISSKTERIKKVELAMNNYIEKERYCARIQSISYSYEVLKILNQMFRSVCLLECIQEEHIQLELQEIIKNKIQDNRCVLVEINKHLLSFDTTVYEGIQEINLRSLTGNFFRDIAIKIKKSVNEKKEMSDFAIAEFNLSEFCKKENLREPEILFKHKDDMALEKDNEQTYFTPDLINTNSFKQNDRIHKNKEMIKLIKEHIKNIAINTEVIEFYTQEDSRTNQYFYDNRLQNYRIIRCKTLAVLDDRSNADMDLLFTTEGIIPIIKGNVKSITSYKYIHWSKNNSGNELIFTEDNNKIVRKYNNGNIDMKKLYELIQKLEKYEVQDEKEKSI